MAAHPPAQRGTVSDLLAAFLERVPPEQQSPDLQSPRGRILMAARELFAAGGFRGTSTRAIAATAQVNQAMIHYYFSSKKRLYQGVIATEFFAMMRSIGDHAQADQPAEEILIELPLGILREFHRDPVRRNLLRREIGGGAQHLREALLELRESGPQGMRTLITPHIRRAQALGHVPRVPTDTVLQFLLSIAYGTLFMDPVFAMVTGRDPDDANFQQRRWRAYRTLLRRLVLAEEVRP